MSDAPVVEPRRPPFDVMAFRAATRPRLPAWYPARLHVAFELVGLPLLAWLLAPPALPAHAAGWLLLTVLQGQFAEYVVHRFPLHRPWKRLGLAYLIHALSHHRFFASDVPGGMGFEQPKDLALVLFGPVTIALFLLGAGTPLALLALAVDGVEAARAVFALGALYLAFYEALHLIWHLPEGSVLHRLPLLRAQHAHHARHHALVRMAHANFGITTPLMDLLFGTLDRPDAPQGARR